ncbi:DUF1534 domain-containing protein [Pseudomonas savastanoi pv. phaseolicola]|nr:DUF1534 domain-containing protein [Pseudomonas savastanoi pv. phaseolicola]
MSHKPASRHALKIGRRASRAALPRWSVVTIGKLSCDAPRRHAIREALRHNSAPHRTFKIGARSRCT